METLHTYAACRELAAAPAKCVHKQKAILLWAMFIPAGTNYILCAGRRGGQGARHLRARQQPVRPAQRPRLLEGLERLRGAAGGHVPPATLYHCPPCTLTEGSGEPAVLCNG